VNPDNPISIICQYTCTMISIRSLICLVVSGVEQVQSADAEGMALLSVSSVAPMVSPTSAPACYAPDVTTTAVGYDPVGCMSSGPRTVAECVVKCDAGLGYSGQPSATCAANEEIFVWTGCEASAPPTNPPFTDPPMAGTWDAVGEGIRCNSQDFNNFAVDSRYTCEQRAIGAWYPFYQFKLAAPHRTLNGANGLCAICKDDLSYKHIKNDEAWTLYRDPALWQNWAGASQCTGKKKDRRDQNKVGAYVQSQKACQSIAETLGHVYYQWNAQKQQCSTSYKCKFQDAADNMVVSWAQGTEDPWVSLP